MAVLVCKMATGELPNDKDEILGRPTVEKSEERNHGLHDAEDIRSTQDSGCAGEGGQPHHAYGRFSGIDTSASRSRYTRYVSAS